MIATDLAPQKTQLREFLRHSEMVSGISASLDWGSWIRECSPRRLIVLAPHGSPSGDFLGRLANGLYLRYQSASTLRRAAHDLPYGSCDQVRTPCTVPKDTPMRRPVLLFDVMETLVVEPFFEVACAVTGLKLPELWEQKNPDHWEDFEKALIDEQTYCDGFFRDGRGIDRQHLRRSLFDAYRWVDGMHELVAQLAAAGWQMHTFSNYPIWFEMIEQKLQLARYLQWTFVSHKTGLRKPDLNAYLYASETMGVPPHDCLFIDDRVENVEAAQAVGMDAIHFVGTDPLRTELSRRGVT